MIIRGSNGVKWDTRRKGSSTLGMGGLVTPSLGGHVIVPDVISPLTATQHVCYAFVVRELVISLFCELIYLFRRGRRRNVKH